MASGQLRFVFFALVLTSSLVPAASYSEVTAFEPWLKMSDKCESLIFEQDETVFDGLPTAEPLINVQGLREKSVADPNSSLVMAAVADSKQWFLCVVTGKPPVLAAEAGGIVGSWIAMQVKRSRRIDQHLISVDDGTTLSPMRVRCGRDGKIAVILAFLTDTELRTAVTDRLPPQVRSPCEPAVG